MFKLRFFTTCLALCLTFAMCSAAMANFITNGDFESVTGDRFDGWTSINSAKDGYTVVTSPMAISGTSSARIISLGKANGDCTEADWMKQQFSTTSMSDFQVDLDFAFLDCGIADASHREFTLFTTNGSTNVDILKIVKAASGNHVLQAYATSPAQGRANRTAGQLANITSPDVNLAYNFDGETPEVNHLTLVGTDYGTVDASLTIVLNGDWENAWELLQPAKDVNCGINGIAFLGASGSVNSDYLVDNVSVTVTVPEPGAMVLLMGAIIGLINIVGSKQK